MRVAGARRFDKCLFFPKVFDFRPGFKNSVILGLGGNIGDVKSALMGCILSSAETPGFTS